MIFSENTVHKQSKMGDFTQSVLICLQLYRLTDDFTGIQQEVLRSTEIVSIHSKEVKKAGDLNEARVYHGMGVLVIGGVPTLAAFGGISDAKVWLSSVELWDDANECWIMSEMRLPGPGYTFASYSSIVNYSQI